ncbi:MAG: acetylglutamate kinase [Clostridiales bacterium]|jgi:acetylglutamate kinase|nr:acetylglutamate kinase [Clostridiales bacterium]
MEDGMQSIIKKAEILIEALPYIQKLSGATVVIKYGGNAMVSNELKNTVMDDIVLLKCIGLNPIVVHGGGPEISKTLERLDIKSEFVNGLRVTDEQTMEVAQMVLVGKTNKEIVSLLNLKGAKAIGLCGIDGSLIECERLTQGMDGGEADLGYVGRIVRINSKVLGLISKDEYIPVVAPVGVGRDGHSYNINADTVAAEIAAALRAEKLILLTDVDGVKLSPDDESAVPVLTAAEVHDLIRRKVISKGMIPKVLGCLGAIEAGVGRTHIIDGRIPHCILLEIFTNRGIGTMILNERVPYHDSEQI